MKTALLVASISLGGCSDKVEFTDKREWNPPEELKTCVQYDAVVTGLVFRKAERICVCWSTEPCATYYKPVSKPAK